MPSPLDPVTVARQQLLLPGDPDEEAALPNPVDLEPPAEAVADANANPPYVFELGPDQGRRTVDAVQSGPVRKLPVDIQDSLPPRRRLGLRQQPYPLRSAVPDPDAPGRRDPQERLPAPQDAPLSALAVEHVLPLGLGVPFDSPPGRPGGLVAVDEQHAAPGAPFLLPALFPIFNHHDDLGDAEIDSHPPADRLRVASTPPPTGPATPDADLAGAGWRGRTPGG